MENTDSGVQRAEQLCGGHEDTGEKAETALRRAGSRTWAKADVTAGADGRFGCGLTGQQDQWDQLLPTLKLLLPLPFQLQHDPDSYPPRTPVIFGSHLKRYSFSNSPLSPSAPQLCSLPDTTSTSQAASPLHKTSYVTYICL